MLTDLKYTNEDGWILATNTLEGVEVSLKPGDLIHSLAVAGSFGPIAAYVAPPKPEELPTYATAGAASAAFSAWLGEYFGPLISYAPFEEQLSWPTKEIAAREYIAGTALAKDVDLIDAEAAIRGISGADLADLILGKAQVFRQATAQIAGLRGKYDALLAAEPDPFAYDALLVAGQDEARAAAAVLGVADLLGGGV